MQATIKCSSTSAISFRMQSLGRGYFQSDLSQCASWSISYRCSVGTMIEQFTLTRFLGQCSLSFGHNQHKPVHFTNNIEISAISKIDQTTNILNTECNDSCNAGHLTDSRKHTLCFNAKRGPDLNLYRRATYNVIQPQWRRCLQRQSMSQCPICKESRKQMATNGRSTPNAAEGLTNTWPMP